MLFLEDFIWRFYAYGKINISKNMIQWFELETKKFVDSTSSEDILSIVNITNGFNDKIEYMTMYDIFGKIDIMNIPFKELNTNNKIFIRNDKQGIIKLFIMCIGNNTQMLPFYSEIYIKNDRKYSITIGYKNRPWFIEIIKDNDLEEYTFRKI